MENTEKMYLVPKFEMKDLLEKVLKLAKFNMFNEDLNVILNGNVIENSNIIDFLMNNKDFPYKNEIDSILRKKEKKFYTEKSPKYYKKEKTKWISVD